MERLPRFVVVSDDAQRLVDLISDLERRFGRDYELAGASSPEAPELLRRSAVDGCRLALVVVDERVTGPSPWKLFGQAREVDPAVKRVLLVHRGNWSSLHPVVGAMALGQVDYHLYSPWIPLERILYPAISEILSAWDRSQEAHGVALRVVGYRSDARSHDIQDKLTRAAVPFRFYERDSDEGRALLRETGRSSPRHPSSPCTPAPSWRTQPTRSW
jgi:thioredoxin reductase (NADPH)